MVKKHSTRQQAGLEILAAGRKTQTIQSRLKHWRTLNAYALVYIYEGSGSFESNETVEQKVEAGQCFLLFPGISHYYGPPKKGIWKEIWVLFRGELADFLRETKALNSASAITVLQPTRRSGFQRNMENLADFYRGKASDYRLHCTSLLYSCLLQITLPLEAPSPLGGDSLLLEEMKQILHRHMRSSRKIPEYFQTSRYSYNTLRMEFTRLTGESPGQYLNTLRMQHAEEQLLWSGLSITEICKALGFNDSRYFSRAFKKYAGSSPGEFRRRYHLIR